MSVRVEELAVADLAAAQWGLLTTAQAVQRGVSRLQLSRLAAAGLLDRYAHGVYRLHGAGDDIHAELRAAWLSLDPARTAEARLADPSTDAVVSHASAAALHGLGDILADHHEFTIAKRRQTQRADLRLHKAQIAEVDVTIVDGLPVTTPTRTVVDLLADKHDTDHVATVLADAVRAGTADLEALPDKLAPHAARLGHRAGDGSALLEALLERGGLDQNTLREEILASPVGQQLATAVASTSMAATLRAISDQIEATVPRETLDTLARAARSQLAAHPGLAAPAASPQLRATLQQLAAQQNALAMSPEQRAQIDKLTAAALTPETRTALARISAEMSRIAPMLPNPSVIAQLSRLHEATSRTARRTRTPDDHQQHDDHEHHQ